MCAAHTVAPLPHISFFGIKLLGISSYSFNFADFMDIEVKLRLSFLCLFFSHQFFSGDFTASECYGARKANHWVEWPPCQGPGQPEGGTGTDPAHIYAAHLHCGKCIEGTDSPHTHTQTDEHTHAPQSLYTKMLTPPPSCHHHSLYTYSILKIFPHPSGNTSHPCKSFSRCPGNYCVAHLYCAAVINGILNMCFGYMFF